ncbi:MAG: dephospho-CoA kinase [Caldilineaceae bacterium SB0675_bin_29]|uniref:Dephospho-CoA kinase n=1 Tax=Caldilineaceae bacterium SB0675_bin_29 TaxID=2605266 RepID=A0A6B1G314_9CHLR|nr:dephospho-CoA kinase [Caldilineaceae bacterium SB0675_bin_29]
MSRKSLVIGLTGNIATGKSTILSYLREKCAFIIDADKLGHRVIEPGGLMATRTAPNSVRPSRLSTHRRRLLEARRMEESEARQMIDLQPPQAAKVNQADRVIENDGSLTELHAQLDAIWEDLKRRYPRRMTTLAR